MVVFCMVICAVMVVYQNSSTYLQRQLNSFYEYVKYIRAECYVHDVLPF